MNSRSITSPQNHRIKDAARLRLSRHRTKQQRTLVDGIREIGRAVDAKVELVEVFVCRSLCQQSGGDTVLARIDKLGVPVWDVSPEVFSRLAFGKRHEGLVAVAHTPCPGLEQLHVADNALVAVACGLEKPGNVGAIIRSADAAGVDAVIVADPATDLFNPNCIRASLGTIFAKPVVEAAGSDALAWLRSNQFKLFAARLDADCAYSDVDFRGRSAILLGSESSGLSKAWRDADVKPIGLPMHGTADSLNVSAAAAVLFYEALRQRTGLG